MTKKQRPTLSLGELFDRTCEHIWKGQKAEAKSVLRGELVLRHFGRDCKVDSIATRDVNDFRKAMEALGNANATVNRKVSALSRMLSFAKEEDYLSDLPVFKKGREGGGRIRYLTPEEEASILALCKLWGWMDLHNLVVFLLDTGARCGEALKLQWVDVGGKRVAFVDTKNEATRAVPMTDRVIRMLADRRINGLAVKQPFDLKYDVVHRAWDRLRDHLGFAEDKQFVLHMLRHSCASRLMQRGAHPAKIQAFMGHKTIQVTMRYAHLAPDSLDDLTALLEARPQEKPAHLNKR